MASGEGKRVVRIRMRCFSLEEDEEVISEGC